MRGGRGRTDRRLERENTSRQRRRKSSLADHYAFMGILSKDSLEIKELPLTFAQRIKHVRPDRNREAADRVKKFNSNGA